MKKKTCPIQWVRNSKGFSLVSTMAAVGVMGVVSVGVMQVFTNMNKIRIEMKATSFLIGLQNEMNAATKNHDRWIDVNKTKNSALGACLVEYPKDSSGLPVVPANDTRTFSCPDIINTTAFDKAVLSQQYNKDNLSSSPIYDLGGRKIAGTRNNPVYFNGNGAICDPRQSCRFLSYGYMARSASSTTDNPKDVSFHMVVTQNSKYKGAKTSLRPKVFSLHLGNAWERNTIIADNIAESGVCPTGTFTYGIDASGKVACRGLPGSCPQGKFATGFTHEGDLVCQTFERQSCGSGKYVYGMDSNGSLLCANLPVPAPPPPPPPPPPGPPQNIVCESHSYAYKECPTSGTITSATLIQRFSSSGCNLGSSFGFTGSKLWVSGGCRGRFNVQH